MLTASQYFQYFDLPKVVILKCVSITLPKNPDPPQQKKCEQFSIGSDIHEKHIQFLERATKTCKGGLGQMNVQTKNIEAL